MLSPLKTIAILCMATVLTMPAQQRALASENVGVREISVPSPERGTDLDVTVWYQALPGGKSTLLGESTFFVGTPAMLGAPISEVHFPLSCFRMAPVSPETRRR